MKLTKAQRETVRMMFGGRCAYCGCELGARFHVDHVESVRRRQKVVNGKLVQTGIMDRAENDRLDNLMPACAPCNIDKHASDLEGWRNRFKIITEVLQRNSSIYRHAIRMGRLQVIEGPVVFHFERSPASTASGLDPQRATQVNKTPPPTEGSSQ